MQDMLLMPHQPRLPGAHGRLPNDVFRALRRSTDVRAPEGRDGGVRSVVLERLTVPLFMDVHRDLVGLTVASFLDAHRRALALQDREGVRCLDGWFDDHTGTAFCLSAAPSPAAVIRLHRVAHGLLPDEVREVQAATSARPREPGGTGGSSVQ